VERRIDLNQLVKRGHFQIQKGGHWGLKGASTHPPLGTDRKSRRFPTRGRPRARPRLFLPYVRFGSMLLKKSVTNDERAIFDS